MLGVIQLGQVGRHVGRSYIWGRQAAMLVHQSARAGRQLWWSINQPGQVGSYGGPSISQGR